MSNLYLIDVTSTTVERVQVLANSAEEAIDKISEICGIEDSELISCSVNSIVYTDVCDFD